MLSGPTSLSDFTKGEAADGIWQCFVLERALGDPDYPAIPYGTYPVTMRWSTRFQRILPHIEEVPGRMAIEIHSGNYPQDTEGCLIVGKQRGDDVVLHSRVALEALLPKIQDAVSNGGHCTIEIVEASTIGGVTA